MTWTTEEKDFLADNAGKMDLSQLSKELGKKETTVAQHASRNGISVSFYGRGKRSNVKEATVEEIKRLLGTGAYTHEKIGEMTGVKKSYVANISAGRRRCGKQKEKQKEIRVSTGTESTLNKVFC